MMRTAASIDALFPKTRQAILAATFLEPRRRWYMRELARQLELSPSSLQRELDSLVRGGLLRRTREGKHVYFQAATDTPVFAELRGLILKTAGLADVIRSALEPFAGRIQWAFIYGSVARSQEHAASDVDLMIIGHLGLAPLASALRRAEHKLHRIVNPTVYTPEEFVARVKARHHFTLAVRRAKKIFVWGDPREFGRTLGR